MFQWDLRAMVGLLYLNYQMGSNGKRLEASAMLEAIAA
jgi:hypothetical protein